MHCACTPYAALSAFQDGNLLVPQYMAAQLDPSMGMDPSMEGTLQQEEEEDQYDNGLEDAIRQEQGDADQGLPPLLALSPSPPPPPNTLASNLVWSSSLHVRLSLEPKTSPQCRNTNLLSPDVSEARFPVYG